MDELETNNIDSKGGEGNHIIRSRERYLRSRVTVDGAKTALWQLLTALYEDELIEEPHRREIILSNIERQKDNLLVNILGEK